MSGKSVLADRNRDCLACKAISASGLFGAAAYIGYQSKKFSKTPGVVIMLSIASALVYLGTARVFDLPPFPGRSRN